MEQNVLGVQNCLFPEKVKAATRKSSLPLRTGLWHAIMSIFVTMLIVTHAIWEN